MIFLYNIGIFFYSLAIFIASPFNTKARHILIGRKNWKQILKSGIEKNSKYIWIHCASLGEFEQGRPLVEEIKKQFPEYKIVLTFFSPSGYEIRKNYQHADCICYLPADTRRNARIFINLINPEKAFFIKYEYWFHFINRLKKENIPLYLVSAIFREKQVFFKNTPGGKWYRKMLSKVEHFFVQNEKSGQLLTSIGLSNFTVSGDTRFDRVAAITQQAKELPPVNKFKGNALLVVAGSTWKPDEELLSELINNHREVKFILAPHEVSATNINRLAQLLKNKAILYSTATISDINRYQVLIIDSIGLLSSLYKYGDIAYIGGGFGVGIHNILEAATFGMPILFGPNYQKFAEAVALVDAGDAFPVNSGTDTEQQFTRLLLNLEIRMAASEICKNYVAKNIGATKFIIKKVFNRQNLFALFLFVDFFLKNWDL